MTEDWTGLTDAERLEKAMEALKPFSDIADRELDDEGYWFDPHEALSAVVDVEDVRNARSALASYRAAVEAETADALLAGPMTAEAMPDDDDPILGCVGCRKSDRRSNMAATPDGDLLCDGCFGAEDDGWIKWGGGECPVDPETLVDVRQRDGMEWFAFMASHFGRSSHDPDDWWTGDCSRQCEITAYRLHKEPR